MHVKERKHNTRKLISIILVAIMPLSTLVLTSCDKALETYGNISGIYTEDFFNYLVLNEETNVYKLTEIGVKVYFENGILVYFKLNGQLMFGNVGSTVIEIPESHKL